MSYPLSAFNGFTPVRAMLPHINKQEHPATWSIVHDEWTGSPSFSAKRWLAGYRKYGDDFERAAKRLLHADGSVFFHEEMSDPWKVTGYAQDRFSPTTLRIAEQHAKAKSSILPNLMRVVVARGMAPKALETAADWFSGGRIGKPGMFSLGWPSLVFGGYASQWSARDLAWLARSGITPDEYLNIVYTLIGHPTELGQVLPPSGGMPFEPLRLIIGEGLSPEYAVELTR